MRINFVFLLFLLSSCNSSKQAMNTYGPELFQHWTHSYEDDTDGVRIYRPANYAFPPSRGREGFEIAKDGAYVRHAIGPDDRPQKMEGVWKMKGKNKFLISIPKMETKPFEMKIISVEKGMLKMER